MLSEKRELDSESRAKRGERGLWQRRWEHLIRDQADFNRHGDDVHWNPVTHGWVRRVADWPRESIGTDHDIYDTIDGDMTAEYAMPLLITVLRDRTLSCFD